MVEFFKDIFEYHHHFNQQLADLLMEHADRISERTIPLFSHMINAHQIWNSRINEDGKVSLKPEKDFAALWDFWKLAKENRFNLIQHSVQF